MAVQWKWSRWAVLAVTVVGFGIPIASVKAIAGSPAEYSNFGSRAAQVVAVMQGFGMAYALLAAGAGLAIALLAWSSDHRGRHVYALSLPVARSRYAAMRFGSGALFLLLPTVGVLAGTLIAVLIAPIPSGLHGYPIALTLRFMLSSAVAYSIFFAIAASTPKAAGGVLGAIAAVLVVAFLLSAASVEFNLLSYLGGLVFSEPGLLSVFTGRWMLIDA